jgi:hypothetical protein
MNRTRQRVESSIPKDRDNPFPWRRHRVRRNVLVRSSDVGEPMEVQFLEAQDATRFLVELAEKQAIKDGMTLTQIQREKLRHGLEGW